MLYRTLKALITKGKTDGLAEKIDIFFATGKLTESEYNELTGMLTSTSTEV
nr:MAG TPA: Short C-terminal domain [Caudoviricetes sp.]DAU23169.1 MAG TPA: Short C-terminal domain [Caudoviricetes sp.]